MVDVNGFFGSVDTVGITGNSIQDGYYVSVDSVLVKGGIFKGARDGNFPTPQPQHHFRMRAWNTVTLSYEIWTSIGDPDPNPPSGDPVTGVSIIGEWDA